ncbi:MAG: HAD family hydrolase [Candidatus Micrarchaeota archaeon]|nr:HAD family hydrolase [Candidatus Micrarchaeota archaeon]
MPKTKAIIFDWGRTLYDKENEKLFPETVEVLDFCSKKYDLAIVSLATDNQIEGRFAKLDRFDLRKYFKLALFHASDKDSLFRNAVGNLNLPPEQVLVVDDRARRLGWAIKSGCRTIWIRRGKFSSETPDAETGTPNFTVDSLKEILRIV